MNEKSLIFSLFSKFLEDEKDDISPEESGTDKKESETEDGGTSKDGAGGAPVSYTHLFVIRGNAVIGFIIFLIIVLVQFIVITKGSERVAEVAARFTLDAMPGKQMAIDADLNSGLKMCIRDSSR